MMRMCLQWAATVFAAELFPRVRWVRSEVNVADAASRFHQPPRFGPASVPATRVASLAGIAVANSLETASSAPSPAEESKEDNWEDVAPPQEVPL